MEDNGCSLYKSSRVSQGHALTRRPLAMPMRPSASRARWSLGRPLSSACCCLLGLLVLMARGSGTLGCIHCGAQFKHLKARFARLCAQYREQYQEENCTRYPWGRKGNQGFALDEMALDLLLEKTHRVFRVIEINQSIADFADFWAWIHEVKLPEETWEALCPPACHGSVAVFNCSTCRNTETVCWTRETCYPGYQSLQKVVVVTCSIAGSCLLLGFVSCALEFWFRQGTGAEPMPG